MSVNFSEVSFLAYFWRIFGAFWHILARFWRIFGALQAYFRRIFGVFSAYFQRIFGAFLARFWPILGLLAHFRHISGVFLKRILCRFLVVFSIYPTKFYEI